MNRSPLAGLVAAAVLMGAMGAAHAEPEGPRSATAARLLSVGGVVASGALIAAGLAMPDTGASRSVLRAGEASLLVTPALGEIYSGHYLTGGTIARVAGAGLGAVALVCLARTIDHGCGGDAAEWLLSVGSGVFIGGVITDLIFAGAAADDFNRKHAFRVAPAAIVTPTGTSAALGFGGRF